MPSLFEIENRCKNCGKPTAKDFNLCWNCFKKENDPQPLNEPEHYHKHEIDTIDFLQKGFPPSVFKGFALGSAIKYLHRYENKNGIEDLEKAKDYIQRLILFHKGENVNDSN